MNSEHGTNKHNYIYMTHGVRSQEVLNPRDIPDRPGREMEVGLERLGNTCKLCYIEAKAAM